MVKKILPFLTLFWVALGGLFWWGWGTSPACLANCSSKEFVVNKGESLKSVAYRLKENGFIRSPFFFELVSFLSPTRGKIQAGIFNLSPALRPSELVLKLSRGKIDLKVTLVEGLRREEMADKLVQSNLPNFQKEDFLKRTISLEGKLFPDTYLFPQSADAVKVTEVLIQNFNKKAGSLLPESLILASIVEREVHGNDRAIVAGILLKRLAAGWPMQVDATVQYAVASEKCEGRNVKGEMCEWWPKNLTKNDLEIKSPYNTYLNKGLPPGPICNPGLAAIRAVINPVQTDYWYYLSDKNGVTRYAKTIEEHNQNIRRYLLE